MASVAASLVLQCLDLTIYFKTTCFVYVYVSDTHFIFNVGCKCGGYLQQDHLQWGHLAELINLGTSILEGECLLHVTKRWYLPL